MKKIIAAGHICLDITPVFPAQRSCRELNEVLIPGKLVHMEGADVHTGGSVANTGLALKLLGNDVVLMALPQAITSWRPFPPPWRSRPPA